MAPQIWLLHQRLKKSEVRIYQDPKIRCVCMLQARIFIFSPNLSELSAMHTPSSVGVILLLLSVCFAAAQDTPSHCDVFVSNDKGNDADSGSIHSPFKTLNRSWFWLSHFLRRSPSKQGNELVLTICVLWRHRALQSAKETESFTYLVCVEQASYEGQSNEQLQTDTRFPLPLLLLMFSLNPNLMDCR